MKYLLYISSLVILINLTGCQTLSSSMKGEQFAPDPKAAELNMQLGLNYLQRGQYKIALEKLEKALQQNPNLPSAHNTIAILYQQLGENDKAETHFKEAISRAPDYSEAENNYGVFLCQQARYAEAEKYFLSAIKNPLYKGAAGALENAGLCANRIPDAERAQKFLRRALALNPNLAKSLFEMAKISYDSADYDLTIDYLVRYKKVAQWDPKSLMLAIKAAKKLNDDDAVSSYLLLLKAQFPDSEEAHQANKGQY